MCNNKVGELEAGGQGSFPFKLTWRPFLPTGETDKHKRRGFFQATAVSKSKESGMNGANSVGPEKHFNHFSRNVIGMILAVLDCRQNLPAHSKSLQSASMKPTSSDTAQTSFLLPDLEKQLDPRSLLYRLF